VPAFDGHLDMMERARIVSVMLPVFLSVPAIAWLIFSVVRVVNLFRSRAMKPTLGETLVALFGGLIAAVLAGVVGGIAAMFVCTRLLTGEEGTWAPLILGLAAALFFAVLTFVFTVRWILTYGDSPT
jgi:hypothetical protein